MRGGKRGALERTGRAGTEKAGEEGREEGRNGGMDFYF